MIELDEDFVEGATSEEIISVLERIDFQKDSWAIDREIRCGNFGASLLQAACFFNRIDVVEMLLKNGARVDYAGSYEDSLFVSWSQEYSLVTGSGHYPLSVSSFAIEKSTPLIVAVALGHREIAKALLDHGADRSLGNRWSHKAKRYAKDSQIMRLLDV